MTAIEKEEIAQMYDEVRDDNTETSWIAMTYEGNKIVFSAKGTDYEEFLSLCTADQRVYGYVRITSGDEMSKRAKFVFIAWCGPDVGALKRAKVGVDKAVVKTAIKSFAIEVAADDITDLKYDAVVDKARKAGGANYGTGV